MNRFWQTVMFGEVSFAWTLLFVVCFACVLAFVFEAPVEIIFPIVALGCLTAIAEHVMHNQKPIVKPPVPI